MLSELITLITEESERPYPVDARELWRLLESKGKFADWITRRLWNAVLKENEDYVVDKSQRTGGRGRPLKNYFLTTQAAKLIVLNEKYVDLGVVAYFDSLKERSRSEEDGPDLFGSGVVSEAIECIKRRWVESRWHGSYVNLFAVDELPKSSQQIEAEFRFKMHIAGYAIHSSRDGRFERERYNRPARSKTRTSRRLR